jgi:hypothetical protein
MNKKENQMSDESEFSKAAALNPELRERVAQKAYELYEKRGSTHGLDIQDWLEAERLVLTETKPETKARKAQSKAETERKVKAPLRERSVTTKPGSVSGRP